MSGGVDDIDTMTFPETGGGSRGDGYTSFLLLLHPVHSGVAVMGLAYLMVDTGIEQYTLRSGSLTCVYMRHDTNISCHFKRYFSWHIFLHILPYKRESK